MDSCNHQVSEDAPKTFAYVAMQAVHGPLEVPATYVTHFKRNRVGSSKFICAVCLTHADIFSYIDGPCARIIPDDQPSRRVYCGMVRAVDESLRNITEEYARQGIWEDTILIVSTGENKAWLEVTSWCGTMS